MIPLLLQIITFLISYHHDSWYKAIVKKYKTIQSDVLSASLKSILLFSILGDSDSITIDKAEIAFCKAFSKCRMDYCMVIVVPAICTILPK